MDLSVFPANVHVHGKYPLEMMEGQDLKYKEHLHDLSSWSRQTETHLCM